ncbi:MAG: hypothetical protein IT244_06285 [Bacteroidia bacterium]|nr:hypothetical protein [Bacteroidia bacterium]
MKYPIFFIVLIFNVCCGLQAQSIESLISSGKIIANFTALGGHSEDCIQLSAQNTTSDTLQVWIEAGRRLQAADSTDQDILLVKDIHLKLLPKSKLISKLYGFCCQVHDHSPKKGHLFGVGSLANKGLLRLSKFIASKKFDPSSIQSAIWAISDSLSVSGIGRGMNSENVELIRKVCEIRNIPMPWYETNYGKADSNNLAGKPISVNGAIYFNLHENTTVTVVVKDWNGILVQTLMEDVPKNPGRQALEVEVDVAQLKPGKYKIYVLSDGTNLLLSRDFTL